MQTLRLIFLSFIVISCSSNKTIVNRTIDEKNVKQKITELNKKNINYILFKKYYNYFGLLSSINSYQNCNNCTSNTFYYVLWRENNKNWIQKFDQCGFFYSKELNETSIIDFASSNLNEMKNENVKFYEIGGGKIKFEIHSELRDLIIRNGSKFLHKNFDVLSLANDEKIPNINYDYNNNLKLVKLNKLISNEIKTNDSLKSFKRNYTSCK